MFLIFEHISYRFRFYIHKGRESTNNNNTLHPHGSYEGGAKKHVSSKKRGTAEEAEHFMVLLLKLFDNLILKTQICRFTQFFIFYASSFNELFAEQLVSFLLIKVLEAHESKGTTDTVLRDVLYLASFLSRAKFLDSIVIEKSLKMMIDHVRRLLNLVWDETPAKNRAEGDFQVGDATRKSSVVISSVCFERSGARLNADDGAMEVTHPSNVAATLTPSKKNKNKKKSRIASALMNAIFYIVCYNKHSLNNKFYKRLLRMLSSLDVTIMHELAPSISSEFCHAMEVLHHFDMSNKLYSDIFEITSRYEPKSNIFADGPKEMKIFEKAFPFDPYLLPKSEHFICPSYKEWDSFVRRVDSPHSDNASTAMDSLHAMPVSGFSDGRHQIHISQSKLGESHSQDQKIEANKKKSSHKRGRKVSMDLTQDAEGSLKRGRSESFKANQERSRTPPGMAKRKNSTPMLRSFLASGTAVTEEFDSFQLESCDTTASTDAGVKNNVATKKSERQKLKRKLSEILEGTSVEVTSMTTTTYDCATEEYHIQEEVTITEDHHRYMDSSSKKGKIKKNMSLGRRFGADGHKKFRKGVV